MGICKLKCPYCGYLNAWWDSIKITIEKVIKKIGIDKTDIMR